MTARSPAKWCRLVFDDYLRETAGLTLAQEGVYARLCVLICKSGDALPDNDRALGYQTKAGRAWPRIKADLMAAGLIQTEGGFIRQARCTMEVARTNARRDDCAAGGHARGRPEVQHLVREVGQQVSEIKENYPCSSSADIDKNTHCPSDSVRPASPDPDPWDALDLPERPAPAPSQPLNVVPLPELTPEQQVKQAERLMDRALVDALVAIRVPARSAWGLMARWKNAIGRDKLMQVIGEVQRNPPAGPVVAWITRIVEREKGRRATARQAPSERRGYGDY